MSHRLLALCISLSLSLVACRAATPQTVPSSVEKDATVVELEKLAAEGDANALFELGSMHHTGEGAPKDVPLSKELFEKAAALGDIGSQFNLGVMYYQGEEGTTQDYTKAREWFTKAADAGNARAQFNLGVMYYRGEGMEQDFTKAMTLFGKAAAQNFSEAQFNLGVMYTLGEGVTPDALQAYAWFSLAKKSGNPRADEALASLKQHMSAEQVTAGEKIAETLLTKLEAAAKKE